MKEKISRLLRHDQSLFIDPMKRCFRLFGLDIAVEPTGWTGGNQGISHQASDEVIAPPGASVFQDKNPNRASSLVDPYDGQLDPELVRDVFTESITPAEHSTSPESQPHAVNLAVGVDPEEAGGEDGLSPMSTETSENEAAEDSLDEQEPKSSSTQLPQAMTSVSSGSGEADGSDVSSHSTTVSIHPADAPPTSMVRTMVESIADRTLGVEQDFNLLPDGLEELFQRDARVNVGVKKLLLNLEPVDIRELTEELKGFAESIGAISPPE